MSDIVELGLWLAFLSSEAYSPGYSSWQWLLGYIPPKLSEAVRNAAKAIREVKKIDQGDLCFGAEIKYEWFERPIGILGHLLGMASKEVDSKIEEIAKLQEKIDKGKRLSKKDLEKINDFLQMLKEWIALEKI